MEKFYKLSLLLIIFGVVFSAPAQTVFQNENFDALSNGDYIAEELTTYWDTYTPGGAGGSEDGTVSNTYSGSPNNSMKILDANDVALYFKSDKSAFTSGYHWYSHKMYVPSGKSGYFNLQAEYDSIWAFEVTINDMEDNGNSWIEYGDGDWMYINGNETFDAWMEFDIIVDLDNDEANLWIDGNHILTWIWSDAGANTLQLADYYGYDSNYEAYYDDIVFGVYAGANDTICASATSFTLADANADGYDAVTWTTSSLDGNFNDTTVVNAVYNPSAQDKTDGFVTLTLSANKVGSATPTTDEMVLSFQAEPTANAGTNVTICQDDTYQLQGQVTNEDSFSWFVYAGSGDLSSEIILDPVFTPPTTGWPDGGQTWLELTAEPISPCQTAAKHIVIVTFEPVPTADAGTYDPICIDDLFTTSDASADNYTAVTWTTTGDGSLSGEHTLTTCNYLPGQNDIDAGEFSLTLEAGNDYCGSVTSTVTVTISKPETECPGDMDVCIDDDPVTLTGATPTGGEYSGTGVNASGEFDPATAGEGTWVITYEYTDTYSCVTSCTFNITVHELPPATCPDDFEVCCSDEPVLLEAPQGKASFTKEFTGTHVSEDNGDYYFTPDCGDIDTFEITYTVTDTVYGCVSSCTFDITVNALPEVTCENDTVCCDNGPVILGPEDVKGLTLVTAYSGDDVTISGGNYVFTPDCNNIDDFTINKVVINHETGCKDSCEFTITVKELPTVTCPADDEVCIDDDPFTLTGGTPAGGTYSGTGVTDNEFDPADAGLGAWEITYEYEDTYGCVSSCTFEITVEPAPSVDAGTDASICESGYQLDGSVENGGNTLWTTFGDGTLSNPNVLNPFYTPGASDKNAGFVKLSLVSESISPCTGLYEDFIWLYITRDLPTVFAGADATSCETDPYVISDAQAGDYSSLLWIRLDADGTFDDSTAMKPEYTFGEGDLLQGYAILKLVASPVSPCALLVEDQITITVQDAPIAGAGLDATICEDDSYQLTGASASNHNGLGWYTEFGSGSFDDDSKLYAEYTPGSTDIIEGSVELCLVASPISPCETADEDCMTLYIQLKPTANAGTDADICEGSTHTLSDASADNYSSVTWLGGDGTFSNRNIEKPTYTPAASEYGTTVTLTLRAYPESPCSDYVEDMVDIYIQKQPTA
ncbi:MAG: hypothetical protein K9H16_10200, partial [Bacteroidales bacterium]|nr:hypothetical protein [Bacteroidales bacterium]